MGQWEVPWIKKTDGGGHKVPPKRRPSPAQISHPVMSARFTPAEHQAVLNALQRAGVGFRRFVLESVTLGNTSFQRGLQAGRSESSGLVSPVVDIACDVCGQWVVRVNLSNPQVWGVVRTALASRYHPTCYRVGGWPSVP